MSILAQYPRWTAHSAMLFVALVAVSAGCKESKGPPLLQAQPSSVARGSSENKEVQYRTTPGTPISPVVINDDPPAPKVNQPVASGKSGQAPTLNGNPNGITRDTLNRAFQGAMGSLATCFTSLSQDPMVAVSFEADPSGRPSLVRVKGAPGDTEYCVRNIVQNLRFPSFEGKGVQVELPLSFHRITRPGVSSGEAEEPQSPTPPSLFLQP
jgi:hypothetical protein